MKRIISIIIFSLLASTGGFGQSMFNSVSGQFFNDDPVELGTRFTVSKPGFITALKFYRPLNDDATYELRLYQGTQLVVVTGMSGGSPGWQTARIAAFPVSPGAEYTVSYYSEYGYQAANSHQFPTTNGDLTALYGVYKYAKNNDVPTGRFEQSNYFADVEYSTMTVRIDTIKTPDTIRIAYWYPVPTPMDTVYDVYVDKGSGYAKVNDTTTLFQAYYGKVPPQTQAQIEAQPQIENFQRTTQKNNVKTTWRYIRFYNGTNVKQKKDASGVWRTVDEGTPPLK